MSPALLKICLMLFAPPVVIYWANRHAAEFRRWRMGWPAMIVWLVIVYVVATTALDAAAIWATSIPAPVASPVPYASIIDAAAARNGLDRRLLVAVINQESGFNAGAISPAGAMGLMQIMPATAADLGLTEPFDVAANVEAGSRYLASLLRRYNGNVELALAAYNAGMGRVDACQCVPPIAETQNYVSLITAAYDEATPSPPYAAGTAYRITHYNPNPTPFKGSDYAAGCGTPLFAPVSGTVVEVGYDGYIGPHGRNNSYLIIRSIAGDEVILLHGNYTAAVGKPVTKGLTHIGYEASIGNSTGCHTDMSVRGVR